MVPEISRRYFLCSQRPRPAKARLGPAPVLIPEAEADFYAAPRRVCRGPNTEMRVAVGIAVARYRRVGPGNFTPSRSQNRA
jgi:hypothetical protein